MITRVYIDNYRCFTNFEIRPSRSNLLLGSNGSGKSSFVDLLDRISKLILEGQEVASLFRADDLTRWDTRQNLSFELDLRVGPDLFSYRAMLTSGDDGRLILNREDIRCGDRILFKYEEGSVFLHRNDGSQGTHFPLRGNRSFISGIEERPETQELMRFLNQLRELRIFKLRPPSLASTTEEEQYRLQMDGVNFASWYRHFSQEKTAKLPELFDQLQEALPGFKALSLKGAGKQGRTRDLVVEMEEPTHEVEFNLLSDGQRALIVLYTLLSDLAMSSQILIIDEPENYVGLSELQPWLQHLDDALGDQGQLFLVSHHPEVIDFLASDSPISFERSGSGPVRVGAVSFDRESGLKASEQIVRGMLDVV